jgi:hypothetical protein
VVVVVVCGAHAGASSRHTPKNKSLDGQVFVIFKLIMVCLQGYIDGCEDSLHPNIGRGETVLPAKLLFHVDINIIILRRGLYSDRAIAR